MGIFNRMVRSCKADIHGVMDQLEDQGLLLRQHLREMETALGRKNVRLKKMTASRQHAQQEFDKYRLECDKLEQDLTVAIEKNRDDIARYLIKKLKPVECHRDELGCHIENLDQEITQLKEYVEKQQLQYEQFKLKAAAYFHKAEQREWDKTITTIIPCGIARELCEEEIELELIQRKEAIRGGVTNEK